MSCALLFLTEVGINVTVILKWDKNMYFYSQSVDWENRNMTFYHSNQMSLALSSLTQTWMNVPQEHPHVRRCVQTLLDPSPAAAEKVTDWILISSPVQVRKSLELKTEFSMVTRFPDSDTDSEFHSDCKLNDHIVLCRPFHTAWSQIQISIITANYRNMGWNLNQYQNLDLWM